jgi:signal transduction histidine kinase
VQAPFARGVGAKSVVGVPIVVEGHLWGVMVAWSRSGALPDDAEARLTDFTELVATAISNTEARTEIGRLAEEQVALRRVATLVARDVPPGELFGAVAAEVGGLFGADLTGMIRYERDGTVMAVATWAAEGEHPEVPGPFPLEGGAEAMVKTGRPVREDDWSDVPGPLADFVREMGIRSSVGSPIVVGDRVWGALVVHSKRAQPLPPDTEQRLTNFTELVGTAISDAEARAETARLADEQAALRRVATLVARAAPPTEIFSAVAKEVGALFGADSAGFARLEPDGMTTIVAIEPQIEGLPVGTPLKLGRGTAVAEVLRTARPTRIDDYSDASGPLADVKDRMRLRSSVGCPILVEERLWGALVVGSRGEPLPAHTESHLRNFTDLVATAIANADSRAELAASRARIVAATDDERRRVVRDLHDGAQQRLVHTLIKLKQARSALREEEEAGPLVGEAVEQAEQANAELRELAHGILPAVLTRGGLNAGVDALASRMPVPVKVGVSVGRLPSAVEATAYFVVAEALTNVAKHARAEHAAVMARVEDGTLRVQVSDDGVGGARADGTGLLGLRDRIAAHDGSLRVESPAEGGTLVAAAIPLNGASGSPT